jgi:HEAT repeat protein
MLRVVGQDSDPVFFLGEGPSMTSRILGCAIILLAGLASLQAQVTTPKKEDVPKYLAMLKNSNAKDRALAAEMLGKRGQIQVKDVKNAIEPLLGVMKDDSVADVRKAAATALGSIGTQPKTVIPALVAALKDKALPVNMAAVNALAAYGSEAREAVPALREFAKTKKDKKIMRAVNLAVKQINGKVK